MENSHGLPFAEKISYGLGDLASSMFWKLFSFFLLFFYTDIFGITAAAAGTMLLVTRFWDAANDPIMGMIGDRTRSRWGKFRPYLLFGAVPFAVVGVLTFTTPDWSAGGRLVYAYVTYTLMMMVYTAVNVPYASLMGVMSTDTEERTSLASWRFVGAFSGGLLVTATANPLIEFFNSRLGNEATAFQLTVAVYAVLAAAFFMLTFAGTRERLRPAAVRSLRLREDVADLLKNGPWFLMLGAGISVLIFNSIRDASILFYFKYYVGDQTVQFVGEVGQGALASAFMSSLLIANIMGVLAAKPVSSSIGKKRTFILSGVVTTILSVLFYFVPPHQIYLMFFVNVLVGVSSGIVLPLMWAMYADVSDYSEWKTGRRATGLIFSSSSMSQKIGWTVGGAVAAWLLAAFGFVANMVQGDGSLLGIRLMISVIAGAGALLSVVFMVRYPLSKARMLQITSELEAVRQLGTA